MVKTKLELFKELSKFNNDTGFSEIISTEKFKEKYECLQQNKGGYWNSNKSCKNIKLAVMYANKDIKFRWSVSNEEKQEIIEKFSMFKNKQNNSKGNKILYIGIFGFNNKDLQKKTQPIQKKKVITEDLGKIFEKAICLLYEIEYDGNYKYSLEEANKIKNLLSKLKTVFPNKLKHIAKNGNQYDYVSVDDDKVHLSAKTTKKDSKVCPQVIGQPTKKKFCEFLKIDLDYNLEQIKEYIKKNVKSLLKLYVSYTFDCPIIYYNKHKNKLLFVKFKKNIKWTDYDIKFTHIIKNKKWNESSSIKINNITIGEFQIHKKRDCIKFRWAFENLLDLLNNHFDITNLKL